MGFLKVSTAYGLWPSPKVSMIPYPTQPIKGCPLPTLWLSVSEQRRTWCYETIYGIYRGSHDIWSCWIEVVGASMKGVVCERGSRPLASMMGRQWSQTASISIHFMWLTIPSTLLFRGIAWSVLSSQYIPPYGTIGIGMLPYGKSLLSQYMHRSVADVRHCPISAESVGIGLSQRSQYMTMTVTCPWG